MPIEASEYVEQESFRQINNGYAGHFCFAAVHPKPSSLAHCSDCRGCPSHLYASKDVYYCEMRLASVMTEVKGLEVMSGMVC